ncbi:MAG: endonuclease/exonuclease/phosphatase family protein [Prevotellaceae bacterium]|nr:endonuclease/exonuclease/phosphatase family protein [Prevotella sp.]MDD7257373.1 endonuclease/exonuclease/phosphatase family protein [Prevotellaceae bacterium]MDY6131588.1 endonuclease/exonuclease/phosphatase family protein [Prevotella sp.]
MKKRHIILLSVVFCGVCLTAAAQKKFSVYAVGFYNQENLFDTCHDEGKNDYEFLPTGSYRWGGRKYEHKLKNMSRVLADMGTDMLPGVGCAVIGLTEVENARVLDDLTAQEPLKARNMKYVIIEGKDERGIDCAMLYNPSLFQLKDARLLPYVQEQKKDSGYYTRGFLTVSGTMAGEPVAAIVCHWPSRFSTSFYRESAGRQVRAIKDSLLRENPHTKIFVMGDLNDDPSDKSIVEGLGAKPEISKTGDRDMYNPWYNLLVKQGLGTLAYKGSWNLFDQIVLTPNLLDRKGKKDYTTLTYLKSQIFRRDYLIQTEGPYKGSPKRTHAGGVWLDGYSDHLPVVVYLVKEQK